MSLIAPALGRALIVSAAVAALLPATTISGRTAPASATYPPIGDMVDAGGYRLHAVHVPGPDDTVLPPLIFIHGASSNLRDLMNVFRPQFEGRAELLFVDRPGHGWSERGGTENATPDGQARAIAAAMQAFDIDSAIIIGHSFGGAVTASFALAFPERTAGLVFLAPATHPWPGGVAWYNTLTALPVIGWAFANLIAAPFGKSRLADGVACVFAPNPVPDNYIDNAAIPLLFRAENFRANATDIAGLKDYVSRVAPRYSEIAKPTVIITGDRDGVVLPEIHSEGLNKAIAGSELVWVKNLGHKPDYVATDLAVAAIEHVAGQPRDLAAIAAAVEARIAGDNAHCPGDAEIEK
ncbi:alpha/beta fold hydrolase [Pseudohoeflea coraliihabitans]|uniref:Alpha/beta hydrolase n=1 Tax=Pseudohoeflea coraliihabitans TaxID=2860393 RepID=A0ABS6WR25_9HYPH|nr:alpha/beta hydrolase [Pseudohoeflea sp. DP4N28-3]MBW3097857.1 alpha/beta hydrolase [Pseudohoeflea sp. DP4N28-3]